MTPPPLKSANFHLNIKSSSLKSADGVGFIARAPSLLGQKPLAPSHGQRFPRSSALFLTPLHFTVRCLSMPREAEASSRNVYASSIFLSK